MKHRSTTRRGRSRRTRAVLAVLAVAAIATGVVLYNRSSDARRPLPVQLPTASQSYLGIYMKGFPSSSGGLTEFANLTGSHLDLAMTYSGWFVPFPTGFATTAANEGIVPLVQMDPDNISIAAIASGKYDGYLSQYAEAVRSYGHPVILSFGHEMNGTWYSWGYRNVPAKTFRAAWRHVVTLFRVLGARNVTWLWTVNIINDTRAGHIPNPAAWWPGGAYVNWVGIDGYYLKPSWQFAPLFGPTIAAVHKLTSDPILIAETGAVAAAGQATKIANLYAGIRDYGLLGFVWFDSKNSKGQNFAITGRAAIAAFRQGSRTFTRPTS